MVMDIAMLLLVRIDTMMAQILEKVGPLSIMVAPQEYLQVLIIRLMMPTRSMHHLAVVWQVRVM